MPQSFFDVAGGKQRRARKDCPYLLYIHKGRDDHITMPHLMFKILFEKFQQTCLEMDLSGEVLAPTIERVGYKRGVGYLAPVDARSRELTKEIVTRITVDGQEFRAWEKGKRGKFTSITIFLPPSMKSLLRRGWFRH